MKHLQHAASRYSVYRIAPAHSLHLEASKNIQLLLYEHFNIYFMRTDSQTKFYYKIFINIWQRSYSSAFMFFVWIFN